MTFVCVSMHAAVWSILSWAAIGSDKELMQSAHPSSRDCYTVSKRRAGLDGNTPSDWNTKQGRPHKGNKHRSINTVVLLWGESCRWPSLPMTLLFNREGGLCFQTHPGRPILHPDAAGMFLLFCVSLVFVYTSRLPQSKQTDLLISITNLTNKGMQAAKPTDVHKMKGFSNLSRSVSEELQACSR